MRAELHTTLPNARARENADADWLRHALKRSAQLPALVGHALAFVWDVERFGDTSYHVIRVGEQRVWRERARAEDWERFNEVKKLLKKKYDGRFATLTATDTAALTMLGGSTLATLTTT